MCVSEPVICHHCWGKQNNHNDACEHVKDVIKRAKSKSIHKVMEGTLDIMTCGFAYTKNEAIDKIHALRNKMLKNL